MAEYQHACVSVAGFIQQLAVSYVAKGYWFYVCGVVPERKNPAKTDRKIMAQYGVGISKWARARKKKAGQANLHYLRHERFWVVIATPGESPFFAAEGQGVRKRVIKGSVLDIDRYIGQSHSPDMARKLRVEFAGAHHESR